MKQMLVKNLVNRLYQFENIKSNTWFKEFEWEKLANMSIELPYTPVIKKNVKPSTFTPYLEYIKVENH